MSEREDKQGDPNLRQTMNRKNSRWEGGGGEMREKINGERTARRNEGGKFFSSPKSKEGKSSAITHVRT